MARSSSDSRRTCTHPRRKARREAALEQRQRELLKWKLGVWPNDEVGYWLLLWESPMRDRAIQNKIAAAELDILNLLGKLHKIA